MDVFLTGESDSFTNDSRPHGRMFVRDTINVSMYLSYEFAMNLFHWEVEILGVIYDIKDLLLARLESAYSLIWGSHEIWGKGGTFMISRHI